MKNKFACKDCGDTSGNPLTHFEECLDKPQHTPTPWIVGMYGASADFRAIDIHTAVCKPDGSLLATCGPLDDEGKANAAFIVRAVNCHEELLAIVKEIYDNENDIARRKHSDEMRFRMEEAIAKAEGK